MRLSSAYRGGSIERQRQPQGIEDMHLESQTRLVDTWSGPQKLEG
jgi:hypothetical protein